MWPVLGLALGRHCQETALQGNCRFAGEEPSKGFARNGACLSQATAFHRRAVCQRLREGSASNGANNSTPHTHDHVSRVLAQWSHGTTVLIAGTWRAAGALGMHAPSTTGIASAAGPCGSAGGPCGSAGIPKTAEAWWGHIANSGCANSPNICTHPGKHL